MHQDIHMHNQAAVSAHEGLRNDVAVPAGVGDHGMPVTLPIVHDHDMGTHTPRAYTRRTQAGMDTPPARRRTTPSPARTASADEPIAGKIAQFELEFRARADVTGREHDAAMRRKDEEVSIAYSSKQALRTEVVECHRMAEAESAASAAHARCTEHAVA